MNDLNGWDGDREKEMIGRYEIQGENDVGESTYRLCTSVGIIIANTIFKYKQFINTHSTDTGNRWKRVWLNVLCKKEYKRMCNLGDGLKGAHLIIM